MALLCAVGVSAQTAEEMQASKERIAKLEKLVQPKNCGLAKVDELTSAAGHVAAESILISSSLQNLHSRLTALAGNADVTVIASMVAELETLSGRIKLQTEAVDKTAQLVPEAGKELKSIKNPMKLKAPTQALNYSKDVLEIVGVETAFQVKAVAEMIRTVTSGNK